jgi:hypothetical protein
LRSTYRILFGVAMLALLVLLGNWFRSVAKPVSKYRINMEGFHAIEVGMTEEQVAETLRTAAGDYTSGPVLPKERRCGCYAGRPIWKGKAWISDEACITVYFEDGKLASAEIDEVYPEPLLNKLRRWIGL